VSVYSSNGTWIYITRAAEYYYYTSETFTDKNVDLNKWSWQDLGKGVV